MTDAASGSDIAGLIDSWLSARAKPDLEQLGALTALDAVWHSPVEGRREGRSAVVEEVRRAFENSESFRTVLLGLRCEPGAAVARIRNIATRQGKALDSVQTLYFRARDGVVTEVRIEVDDLTAVEAFWR